MGERSFVSNPEGSLAREPVRAVPKPQYTKKAEKVTNYSLNRTQKGLKRTGKGLKRSRIKPKPQDPKLTAEEKQIRADVMKRDGVFCFICKRDDHEEVGEHFHHIIPKQSGGRGALKELIDSAILRTLISNECHTKVHKNVITPYNFYRWAIEDQHLERLIIMEILINEWAKYVPTEQGELIDQIRERNRQRWKRINGKAAEVRDPKIIALHWEDILGKETND